jgi:hypothetical protein
MGPHQFHHAITLQRRSHRAAIPWGPLPCMMGLLLVVSFTMILMVQHMQQDLFPVSHNTDESRQAGFAIAHSSKRATEVESKSNNLHSFQQLLLAKLEEREENVTRKERAARPRKFPTSISVASSSYKAQHQFLNERPVLPPTYQHADGGAFVHLGKTGGSALSIHLRNGCHSFLPHPCRNITNETLASRLIESYYHVPDFSFLQLSNHDFYMITIRNPYDRFVSVFVFEHYLNRKVRNDFSGVKFVNELEQGYKCFPTLESFVGYLEGNTTTFNYPFPHNIINVQSCRDLARAAFHGRVRALSKHMYFNYEKVVGFIPEVDKQVIIVTRQEKLWDDWRTANAWLGHKGPVYTNNNNDMKSHLTPAREHQHKAMNLQEVVRNTTLLQLPVTRELTSHGIAILCKALQTEFSIYFWLLAKSSNLLPSDVAESVRDAQHRCPSVRIPMATMRRMGDG